MLFSSWQFILVFLPVTLLGFSLLPAHCRTVRKLWLTAASIVFYAAWKVEYLPLLFASILFNYTTAELITRFPGRPGRIALQVGVVGNLLLLGYYKYINFFCGMVGLVAPGKVPVFDIILPLAISFFTFTQISYIVDVSRDPKLHYRFLDYMLFVLFFPHLIAGPIVRHWEIIPQFADKDLRPTRTDLETGFALFAIGLSKKILLADSVAECANAVYGAAAAGTTLNCFDAWLGTIAYALQIYFDFSGYSDMAIGLARMFSIKFPCNFDSPYRALNIIEFWRRWHMSLTRFFREYVYFPMGGSKEGELRHVRNVLVTFLLSGLWHGAGWTFVIWGGLHGVYLVVANQWKRLKLRFGWVWDHWSYRTACALITFVAVLFAWVYFRAPSVSIANQVVASMAGQHGLTMSREVTNPDKSIGKFWSGLGVSYVPSGVVKEYTDTIQTIAVLLALACLVPNSQQLLRRYAPALETNLRPARWALMLNLRTGFAMGVVLFFVARSHFTAPSTPFLYFNF